MSNTHTDSSQVLKKAFDETDNTILTKSSGGTLVTEHFDYISAAYPDSVTEVYTYKTGGSGGTTVATVTTVYTTAAKTLLITVTKA